MIRKLFLIVADHAGEPTIEHIGTDGPEALEQFGHLADEMTAQGEVAHLMLLRNPQHASGSVWKESRPKQRHAERMERLAAAELAATAESRRIAALEALTDTQLALIIGKAGIHLESYDRDTLLAAAIEAGLHAPGELAVTTTPAPKPATAPEPEPVLPDDSSEDAAVATDVDDADPEEIEPEPEIESEPAASTEPSFASAAARDLWIGSERPNLWHLEPSAPAGYTVADVRRAAS